MPKGVLKKIVFAERKKETILFHIVAERPQ